MTSNPILIIPNETRHSRFAKTTNGKSRLLTVLLVLVPVVVACGCSTPATPPTIELQTAAYQGNAEEIRLHIAQGSNLDEKNPEGSTPLITAATFGHEETVKTLIEGGANLNLVNNEGSTALLSAAFLCHTEVVKLLLESGADKNVRNNTGATALDSVSGPFDQVKFIYVALEAALGPLGLTMDYERIESTRPTIAELLR